ncbi:hypothetical protein [Desulfotignum phosphitoxidans]|uniref:Uncharacterized protein n=1 Tax=Desulfotignum phosphitoxidans DSM 13687 TaxID=1286635 RepID=S0G5G1_9BACT|nr:hypothetical protein [Desulfotignum phosphitoxidans]EMS79436.1 hypothetical protein Dpo_5c03630 [Desulfotignum phosphitoxidans DSM 13687]
MIPNTQRYGFQAKGTPGRAILEGRTPAKAAIHNLSGYSAHADQKALCDYHSMISKNKWKTCAA